MAQLRSGEVDFAAACSFDIATVATAVAERLLMLAALRSEADGILSSQRAGSATADDMHRYATIRLVLALQASAGRLPCLPPSTDEVLRRRRDQIVATLLGTVGDEPPVAS